MFFVFFVTRSCFSGVVVPWGSDPLSSQLSNFHAPASGAVLLPSGAAFVQSLLLVVSASLLCARLPRLPLAVIVFLGSGSSSRCPCQFSASARWVGVRRCWMYFARSSMRLLSERVGRQQVSDVAAKRAGYYRRAEGRQSEQNSHPAANSCEKLFVRETQSRSKA